MEGLKEIVQGHSRERSWNIDLPETFSAAEYSPTKYHEFSLDHVADEYTNLTNYLEFYFVLHFLYRKICF